MKTDYWNELESFRGLPEEEACDALRDYLQKQKNYILEKDLNGSRTLPETFRALTELAEAAVRFGLEIEKEGNPRGDFSVIAMGKFGGREMNYQSDLDIIYLYELPEDQEIYARLGARLIRALTLFTSHGYAYHIDTALRPSGNSGTLVSSLASFTEYHKTLGRTWERQALIKARPVAVISKNQTAFQNAFTQKLEAVFAEIAYRDIDAKAVAAEIHHLRERMEKEIAREKAGRYNLKTGRGGLVDIEFATQFLQLKHGQNHRAVRLPGTFEALEALAAENILDRPLAETLKTSYLFLRELGTRLRQELQQPTDELYEASEVVKNIEKKFFAGREPILPRYLKVREDVRAIYTRILTT